MADENAQQDNSRPSVGSLMLKSKTTGERRVARSNDNGEQLVDLSTALSKAFDSILTHPRGSNYTAPLTADTLIQSGPGKITAVRVNSTSAGTLKLWDGESATGGVLLETYTPAAGELIQFPNGGVRFATGCYLDITGTINVTVYYDPTAE